MPWSQQRFIFLHTRFACSHSVFVTKSNYFEKSCLYSADTRNVILRFRCPCLLISQAVNIHSLCIIHQSLGSMKIKRIFITSHSRRETQTFSVCFPQKNQDIHNLSPIKKGKGNCTRLYPTLARSLSTFDDQMYPVIGMGQECLTDIIFSVSIPPQRPNLEYSGVEAQCVTLDAMW